MKFLLILVCVSSAFAQWTDFGPYTASSNLQNAMNSKPSAQTGVGAPSSRSCTQGLDQYFDTSGSNWYDCSATGTPGTWVMRVMNNGSFANPGFIASIPWSKLSGVPGFYYQTVQSG